MYNCFNKIGLSRTECQCFKDIPEGLKKSAVNLFLDELEGIDLELINSTLGCGKTLAKEFEKMATSANTHFLSDFQMRINETAKTKVRRYVGLVGERSYINPVPVNSNFKGLLIEPNIEIGLSMTINDLVFIGNGEGNQMIEILKITNGIPTTEKELTFDAVNGINQITLAEPLVLNFGPGVSYAFIYDSTALIPYNNKIPCGCGEKEYTRGRLIKMNGISWDYEPQISEAQKNAELAYGISLNLNIGCGVEPIICNEFEYNDTFKYRSSIAIWYKMGVLFLEKLFASRNINFDTLANGEYLYTRKKKFEHNYKETVQWLADNTEITESDCFICDPGKSPSFGKNLI